MGGNGNGNWVVRSSRLSVVHLGRRSTLSCLPGLELKAQNSPGLLDVAEHGCSRINHRGWGDRLAKHVDTESKERDEGVEFGLHSATDQTGQFSVTYGKQVKRGSADLLL
jgi:hypothetical protein